MFDNSLDICRKGGCLSEFLERGGEECNCKPNKTDHLESGESIWVTDLNQSGEKRNPRRKMGVMPLCDKAVKNYICNNFLFV